MRRLLPLGFISLFFLNFVFAQKEVNNWFFVGMAAMTFNYAPRKIYPARILLGTVEQQLPLILLETCCFIQTGSRSGPRPISSCRTGMDCWGKHITRPVLHFGSQILIGIITFLQSETIVFPRMTASGIPLSIWKLTGVKEPWSPRIFI